MTLPEYLSRQEAARLLDVPLATVDRMIAVALLPRYRLHGVYVRVRTRDVQRLLDVPRDHLMRC